MTPTAVLSFDLELAWGEFHRGAVGEERLLAARRALPELLRRLERRRLSATFAVVGHLLLEGCDGHPEHPRPRLAWRPGDWFDRDPRSDERRDPLWYAPALVRAIAAAAPGHDVGAHGFAHVPLDDPGVGPELARAEVREAGAALARAGHEAASFVFPRNGISYLEVLQLQGFSCFRGVEETWWRSAPRPLRRLGHLADQALGRTPPVGLCRRRAGLVEVPSSMLFLSREGVRRHVPLAARVRRARRGLARARARGAVFHLWMHVEDLVPDTGAMLDALDLVLAEVAERRDRGELDVRTMAGLAHAAAALPASAAAAGGAE